MNLLSVEQQLKLYVLAHGINIAPKAEMEWQRRFNGPLSLSDYASTSGVCICINNKEYVNAPFIEAFTRGTLAELIYDGEFAIAWDGSRFPISVMPVPAYNARAFEENSIMVPYTDLGVTHTDRCRISPIAGCAWNCGFCDSFSELYVKKSKEELLRVIEIAKDDILTPARHAMISGGTPVAEDEPWIDEVYEFIAGNSPIPVDVMMPPRKKLDYSMWLRSVGVNMISVNIEIWDWRRAKELTPQKAELFGREYYLDYIENAVRHFGMGFVQSLLVFGSAIEPIENTLQGVAELVKRGCIPVLSPFRPNACTPLGDKPQATMKEMKQVYLEAQEICERSNTGIMPGPRCIPCQHNTVAFNTGSEFYFPIGKDLTHR